MFPPLSDNIYSPSMPIPSNDQPFIILTSPVPPNERYTGARVMNVDSFLKELEFCIPTHVIVANVLHD